ncbi:type II toxin-antitoxin system RelE/ParE family toxin [Arthrospiribacter ruber]|uniref:Type II toxin-antitoxin system RelE/ParE family toxin n=1 Tax=Arthrospiribacter ruber TaxID=2487934 RepID=A0A951IV96_9BACT|nr:type II toxin-antitoxin system RelE/ParE family toxin [Arthrospiribacter ruber]
MTLFSKDSVKYARFQVKRLKTRNDILKTNPFSGQTTDFFNDKTIRQLTEGSYIIIYKIINESRIDILTVHHTARNLNKRNLGLL